MEYNLDNLLRNFKKYLFAGNKLSSRSIKNYISDLKHFFGWCIFTIKSQNLSICNSCNTIEELLNALEPDIFEDYKSYLLSNNTPHKTINRRLSSIRKLYNYLINQNIIKSNPTKNVHNLNAIKHKNKNIIALINDPLLSTYLGLDYHDNKFIKEDLQEFINFLRLN